MQEYYVKRWDAESKIGSWCDWDDRILDGKFVRYNGGYNRAMFLRVPLFNKNGECIADVM